MNDDLIGSWLAERRKMIAGLLAFAGVLIAGGLVPESVELYVQGLVALLGVYGIHEVANDQPQ